MAEGWRLLDELGLVLDSDPRKMSQAGQLHSSAQGPAAAAPAAPETDDGEDEDADEEE